MKSGLKVFAPATVANVGVGYDILGFAIDKPGDEIIVRQGKKKGLVITKITGCKKKLPLEVEKNTAGYGAQKLLEHLGLEDEPIEMEIHKKMPFGSGLGSSAASAAGGVYAINEYLRRPLFSKELARFAVLGESVADVAIHGDNVIPSLLGGIVLIRDNDTFDFIKIPVPPGLHAFVIYPHVEIMTRDARAVLADQVELKKHIRQNGNLGALISGFYTSNLELIQRSLQDHIIEPQRAKLVPHFYELQNIALTNGAMNYTISGAGPSMFGFCLNSLIGENILEKLKSHLADKGIESDGYISTINTTGTYKY
ncbi:MAG: homoserine kinase [Saprospiraceae bacterium]|nr:homoserine kinase [Saprospiraceae bacterium]